MASVALVTSSALATGGPRAIAKLIDHLDDGNPLREAVLSQLRGILATSNNTISFHSLEHWCELHGQESQGLFWSARQVYAMIACHKDKIRTAADAFADIKRTFKYTNFLTFEHEAAYDLAKCIITILHGFQGKGSRDKALQSELFRSAPELVQQVLMQFWFDRDEDKFDPTEHFALPPVDSDGHVKGSGKVSSQFDSDGILRLVNGIDDVVGGVEMDSNISMSSDEKYNAPTQDTPYPKDAAEEAEMPDDESMSSLTLTKQPTNNALVSNQQTAAKRKVSLAADQDADEKTKPITKHTKLSVSGVFYCRYNFHCLVSQNISTQSLTYIYTVHHRWISHRLFPMVVLLLTRRWMTLHLRRMSCQISRLSRHQLIPKIIHSMRQWMTLQPRRMTCQMSRLLSHHLVHYMTRLAFVLRRGEVDRIVNLNLSLRMSIWTMKHICRISSVH